MISGNAQETQVIQFSSNTQINEGNIEKILQSKEISDEVKASFIEKYLAVQEAPKLLPVSTNTPTTETASAEDSKIHKKQFEKSDSSIWSNGKLSIVKKILDIILNFLLLSTVGKIISVFAGVILLYSAIKLIYWIIKKILIFFIKR